MYSISTDNLWEDTDGKDWKKKKTHEFRTDLDEFIDLKHNNGEGKLYNFNQSVFASDSWMQEAIDNPFSEPARQLAKIANNAWKNGEPGLLFADTINNNTPYAECGCKIYTTNPCGEQPLPPFGSCNLGSINISHDTFYDDGIFNYDKLDKVARDMTRFLDNIGDKNKFPNKKFKKWYRKHRPIGIGIMGFADALMRQQIRYGGTESLHFADRVMLAIKNASYNASMKLADERGLPSHAGKTNRRNITTVSIAPTGSIAFLAGCSHGIEPVFAPVYKRTDEHGNEYLFKHPLRNEPYFMSSINDSLEKMPTWSEHIAIQAAVQRHTDSAVSKTINMVNGVQPKDVLDAIIDAWRNGVKGVTIYRTGSRDKEVLEELKEEDSLLIDCPTGSCNL
jgi:ribonucleoside-diphosphate reductase alpha chain